MRAAQTSIAVSLAIVFIGPRPLFAQQPRTWQEVSVPHELNSSPGGALGVDRIGRFGDRGVWVTSLTGDSWVIRRRGSWTRIHYPSGVSHAGSLVFLGETRAWAAGTASGRGPWLASTSDGGKTWVPASAAPRAHIGGFADVKFFDGQFGIAVGVVLLGTSSGGYESLFATTHDGGATWTYRLLQGTSTLGGPVQIAFQSRSVAWAVGGNSIYSTHDGGASWEVAYTDPGAAILTSVARVGASKIFAAGGPGLLLRSVDSGTTWERAKLPPGVKDTWLSAVGFADERRGWAGGDHGTLLETNDGGATWNEQTIGVNGLIRDIEVLDSRVYITGDQFLVLERRL